MRCLDADNACRDRSLSELIGARRAGGAAALPDATIPWLGRGLAAAGWIADCAAVAAAGLVLAAVSGAAAPPPLAVVAVTLLASQALSLAGLFRPQAAAYPGRAAPLAALVAGLTVAAAAPVILALAEVPLSGVLAWAGLAAAATGLSRLAWGTALARLARSAAGARRVLVVGDRERAMALLATIAGAVPRWAFPVGVLLDRELPERPLLGGFIASLAEAERVVREEAVDDVVVALPWSDPQRLAACLETLKPLPVDVHLCPEDAEPFVDGGTSLLAGVPMARLRVKPLSGAAVLAKEAEDKVLGLLLLLVFAPLMAAIAGAVKLGSPGPVLFRQRRFGYADQPFTCLKFRSMDDRAADSEGGRQATRDDPRVNAVGRFLRRTSLDELPQLFNVLGGSMSLVGPRPHAVAHHHVYETLVADYRCRHRMKPGLTGWAQINGLRGETANIEQMRKRVMCDLWYIDNWSLWLDLAILARTPFACLKGTNAY